MGFIGPAGSGHTIRENGTDQTTRTALNFIDTDAGTGLITDDAGNNETEVNLSLYRLEAADHSHQTTGLQAGTLDHGLALTGLGDDDHTQYLLVTGSRAMTGDLDMGGNDVYNVRNYYPDPGGRLTLVTATPVMVADAVNITSIFYALYKNDLVPLYDGTNWDVFRFTELSIVMGSNWGANSNFDCYIYNDAGTLRLVTGAAWTSDTARNEALVRLNGRWTNTASMTGRYSNSATVTVGANQGLYVGSFRTTGSTGTTTWEVGGRAAGGDPGFLYVWNNYNRVLFDITVEETTDSWTYTLDTIRAANASNSNRVSFIRGLNEDSVTAVNNFLAAQATGGAAEQAIGLDTTTAFTGRSGYQSGITFVTGQSGGYSGIPGLGLHFLQLNEATNGGLGTATFYGDNGEAYSYIGFNVLCLA